MGTIKGLYRKVQSLNVAEVATDAFGSVIGDFTEDQKNQLYAGKTKDGVDITPLYINDPYFKSAESAQRYSDWKDKITPNPKRTSGVPNLFIIGTYYDSLKITISGQMISFVSSFFAAENIAQKFKGIYGLGGDFRLEFIKDSLRPAFMAAIRKKTGL